MATTTEKNRATHAPVWGYETAAQTWKDIFNIQMRTAQTIADHSLSFTKKATEAFQQQMEQSVKLGQDTVKYSINMMDDFKKVVFEAADRMRSDAQ